MHVLQWIATKAETADEAYHNVETHLQNLLGNEESYSSTWYDWYVVGGGRWNTGDSDDFNEAYKSGKTNMIISSDIREEFQARLDICMEYRLAEFNHYRNQWNKSDVHLIEKLDSYNGNMDYSMELYPLGKMIDMLQGEWDFNSYFYDLENWSTNPIHMQKDINDVGGVWYLVPVDFHF